MLAAELAQLEQLLVAGSEEELLARLAAVEPAPCRAAQRAVTRLIKRRCSPLVDVIWRRCDSHQFGLIWRHQSPKLLACRIVLHCHCPIVSGCTLCCPVPQFCWP